ncbi:MAG TPA: Gfo/Idh/MocA family oxidoreductase [Rhizomicrobium sp.]
MNWDSNRRQVLSGAVAAAAAASLGGAAFAKARPYRVGVVGAGWMGKANVFALMQVAPVEVVALCDVDRVMLEEARKMIVAFPDSVAPQSRRPEIYRDYRTMFAKHRFDIVIIGTPDHWHALPALAAIKAGAHVYLEKPVALDVVECQALVAAARAGNRVVQVGTQRRASPPHIEARDRVLREGRLGQIGYVEIFGYSRQRAKSFPPPSPPPSTLDWDFYCGPAPLVAYNPGIHPLNWRAFREFGNGHIGDLGVHLIDTCRWMLDLGWPKKISSAGGVFVNTDSISTQPDTQTAQFEYDNLLMNWTSRQWGTVPEGPAGGWGAHIYGDKGTLRLGSISYVFEPAPGQGEPLSGNLDAETGKFPNDKLLPPNFHQLVPLTRPNMRDFIAAIEAGRKPVADIEEGYISTSSIILANIAMDLGRPVRWDAQQQRVTGDDEAQKRLARPYRAPWVHPGAAV